MVQVFGAQHKTDTEKQSQEENFITTWVCALCKGETNMEIAQNLDDETKIKTNYFIWKWNETELREIEREKSRISFEHTAKAEL